MTLKGVRQVDRSLNYNQNHLEILNSYKEAGYHLVNETYICPMTPEQACSVFKWCTESFGEEHWIYYYNHWIFTNEVDAFQFTLTWV